MRNRVGPIVLCVVAVGLLAPLAAVAADAGFRWLESEDPLWAKIQNDFRRILRTDDRANGATVVPYRSKMILRIGVVHETALVLIAHREQDIDPPERTYVRAFSYQVRTAALAAVATPALWRWRLAGLARMDHGPAADVVFTYEDCTACEPVTYLAAFRYDGLDESWTWRIWPRPRAEPFAGVVLRSRQQTGVLIGSVPQFRSKDVYTYECVHAVTDFTGDSLADIAIWCQEQGSSPKATRESLALYTAQSGTLRRVTPTGTLQRSVQKRLCERTPESFLCALRK